MRYVLVRDDDTNALTPVSCLETLYRPFLERGLPVNLAVIPEVRTDARTPEGGREGFLPARGVRAARTVPLASNPELVNYLKSNPGFCVAQHGCHHDCVEFDRKDRADVIARLDLGQERLKEAGFAPTTFVAPHDKFSRVSFKEAARRFKVISSGWFESRRLPVAWWPKYLFKKAWGSPHWRAGGAILLSHPGCLLSYHRPCETMLTSIRKAVQSQRVTVLVTHWWEYFQNSRPTESFVDVLHQTAAWLASRPDVRVISFDDLAQRKVRA